jgi:hypothetical protein
MKKLNYTAIITWTVIAIITIKLVLTILNKL